MHRFYKNGNRNETNEKSEPCQKLLKQAIVLSIMTLLILLQTALIVLCRGNSSSIMDLQYQFHYARKEEQSHDGMLSTSLSFVTFQKEQVIKKPHAVLFVYLIA